MSSVSLFVIFQGISLVLLIGSGSSAFSFYLTFFFKFIFNWRVIALQYCAGFCCTMWISHNYTYISLLPLEPPSHSVSINLEETVFYYNLIELFLRCFYV